MTSQEIADKAKAFGYTKRVFVSNGSIDFEGFIRADADLDGSFNLIDIDEGKTFVIHGWQAETIDFIDQ